MRPTAILLLSASLSLALPTWAETAAARSAQSVLPTRQLTAKPTPSPRQDEAPVNDEPDEHLGPGKLRNPNSRVGQR